MPIAYSRKFNGLYDSLNYPYLIDAKSEISCSDAINAFFDYLERRDELMAAVNAARPIWLDALESYKRLFAEVVGLR